MRTTIRGLRRLISEVLIEHRNHSGSSILGVKHKDVFVKAGSKLAKRIEPDLVDMVTTSYAKVGGNPKVVNPGDLSAEYPNWVVVDIDDDPDVDVLVAASPRAGGMKMAVSATDGSPAAKMHLVQLKRKLYHNGWWGEVSDAPAHIALNKLGIKPVEDEKKVRALLGDKNITWYGEHPEGKFPGTRGWYGRDIGGTEHVKIIVGDV